MFWTVNWFMVAGGILELGACIQAAWMGMWKLAGVYACYAIVSFLIAFLKEG